MNFLQRTLNQLGLSTVARECDVTRQAVAAWRDKGMLPESEHYPKTLTRSTDYASKIAKLAKCKRGDLL